MYAVTVVFYIATNNKDTAMTVVSESIDDNYLTQPDESYQIVQAEEINESPQEG